MVSADCNDISEEYSVLLNELRQYNPELLDKDRMLAVTKCDMLDEELKEHIAEEIKAKGIIDIPYMFISSVSGEAITELKERLYKMIAGI